MAKKSKDKSSKVLMIILIAVIGIVALTLIQQQADAKTQTLGVLDFKIGALDEDGEYVKDTGSIVTQKMHSIEDLEISLEKDAMISYRLYFYDEDENFVSADEAVNIADYNGDIPASAVYFKLVITPTNDAEVSTLEIPNYVGQLDVVFAKD